MIIDTKKLQDKIEAYYAKLGDDVDNNVKDDRQAHRMLTRLENAQIKDEEIIEAIIELANRFAE